MLKNYKFATRKIKRYRKINRHKPVYWYQNINPKPYLIGMAFVFFCIFGYSWYRQNIYAAEAQNIHSNNRFKPKKTYTKSFINKDIKPDLYKNTHHIENISKPGKVFQKKPIRNVFKPNKAYMRKWKYIIIHHGGLKEGSASSYENYHKKKYGGLAYHFVIGNGSQSGDGEIETGYRWVEQKGGASINSSADSYNKWSIAICLVGNYENDFPTTKQMRALNLLVKNLMKEFEIEPNNVLLHSEIVHTECPGKKFPSKKFFQKIGRDKKKHTIKDSKRHLTLSQSNH